MPTPIPLDLEETTAFRKSPRLPLPEPEPEDNTEPNYDDEVTLDFRTDKTDPNYKTIQLDLNPEFCGTGEESLFALLQDMTPEDREEALRLFNKIFHVLLQCPVETMRYMVLSGMRSPADVYPNFPDIYRLRTPAEWERDYAIHSRNV